MSTTYIVKQGDTIYGIAKTQGVTPGELLAANPQFSDNGRTPNRIFPGEEVKIPAETRFSARTDLKRGTQGCAEECPSTVKFADGSGDPKCGWNPAGKIPWKTLISGSNGQVKAEISPPDRYGCVKFHSAKPDIVKVDPDTPTSAKQTLTLAGLSRGESEIRAVCDGKTIGSFAVRVLTFNLPLTVAQSERRPGTNADGSVAADMRYGDYSNDRITKLGPHFKLSDAIWDLDTVKAETLFKTFRLMATTLSQGELETNILAMIDRFERNAGGSYSDPKLTSAVRKHPSTHRFIDRIREELARTLNKHSGDLSEFGSKELILSGQPHFSGPDDTLGGLRIAINDTWAYDVVIQDYQLLEIAVTLGNSLSFCMIISAWTSLMSMGARATPSCPASGHGSFCSILRDSATGRS